MSMNDHGAAMVRAGQEARDDGAGGRSLVRGADVGNAALAAAAEAEVKARYIMARQSPRNDDTARILMLRSCARPAFAEVAIYSRPQGTKKIEGLSIRFAEEARRQWGNMHTSAEVIFEDDEKRIVAVSSTDLEANITERVTVVCPKTMERKTLKAGENPIRSRVNSSGEFVYILPADEGALRTQQKAEEAKARRQTILALIPADILDECKAKIRETQRARDAADPAAAKKRLLDSFAELGIMPDQIAERYLTHPIDQTTPDELIDLRAVYVTLKEGGATWAEVCAARAGDTGDKALDAKAAEVKSALHQKAEAIRNKAGAKGRPTPPDAHRAAAIDRGDPENDGR